MIKQNYSLYLHSIMCEAAAGVRTSSLIRQWSQVPLPASLIVNCNCIPHSPCPLIDSPSDDDLLLVRVGDSTGITVKRDIVLG